MEYVVVRWDAETGGYWLDPRGYVEILPKLAPRIPPGAREYVSDPAHYDFVAPRCVKDLRFGSLKVDDALGSATLSLLPNDSKHDVGLVIRYREVESLEMRRTRNPGVGWIGSVLLDEVLPLQVGVAHELALTGGEIRIAAADFVATWGAESNEQ